MNNGQPQSIEDIIYPSDRRIPISASVEPAPTHLHLVSAPFIPSIKQDEEEDKTGHKSLLDFL